MVVGFAAAARTTTLVGETNATDARSISLRTTSTASQSTLCVNSRKLLPPKQWLHNRPHNSSGWKWENPWKVTLPPNRMYTTYPKGRRTVSQEMRNELVTGCALIAQTLTFLSVTTAIVANVTATHRQACSRALMSFKSSRKQVMLPSISWRRITKCRTPASTV